MKYDIVLEVEGKKFAFKDVEAPNQEDAEIKCKQELKRRIKLVSIQPSPAVRERASNAKEVPTMSGDEMYDRFFGKFKG
jgi:hypothetical protein